MINRSRKDNRMIKRFTRSASKITLNKKFLQKRMCESVYDDVYNVCKNHKEAKSVLEMFIQCQMGNSTSSDYYTNIYDECHLRYRDDGDGNYVYTSIIEPAQNKFLVTKCPEIRFGYYDTLNVKLPFVSLNQFSFARISGNEDFREYMIPFRELINHGNRTISNLEKVQEETDEDTHLNFFHGLSGYEIHINSSIFK